MCCVSLGDSAVCSTDSSRCWHIVLYQSFFPVLMKKDGERDGCDGKTVDQGSFLVPELYKTRSGTHQDFC